MFNKVKSDKISKILGPKFQIDFFSHLRGQWIYRADAKSIDDSEMSHLIAQLFALGYMPNIRKKNGRLYVHILEKSQAEGATKWWLHISLFVLTVITTMLSGALLAGYNIYSNLFLAIHGWQYSFAILSILAAHEFGHYFAARYHGIRATLPYFLPIHIPGINPGTMGAFIKIRSQIPSKKALFDVGSSGPYAGLLVSIIFLFIGYLRLPGNEEIARFIASIHGNSQNGEVLEIVLGKSLMFSFFNDILGNGKIPMSEIYHFPFIFAGWVGLLVTSINLIPIGQLDGGHIMYALLGKKSKNVGILFFVLLVLLNAVLIAKFDSYTWVLWLVIILILIGFRHPKTKINDPLSQNRKVLGWIALAIFVLCFSPLPIYIAN